MTSILRQHLIDPEVCIRCNTCEETCPIGAITHDARNYVVDAAKCNACMACIAPCPTGAIDHWRTVARDEAYGVSEQLTWDALPGEKSLAVAQSATSPPLSARATPGLPASAVPASAPSAPRSVARPSTASTAPVPPWSAAHPYVNLYTQRVPATARVARNQRVTDESTEADTHHIVLDFGATPFPVLEGQSVGILPPGKDLLGRPHHVRRYSVASPRDGDSTGQNSLALTVKRVQVDRDGKAVSGTCSNYLCDLQRGDIVRVTGPFGDTFLMPNHAPTHLLMICTGTGSAPMRAMTERRRRRPGENGGRLMLFFGARTREELPYFGPLMNLPRDFIDVNLAFSRTPGGRKCYVQDRMRERAAAVAELLRDDGTHVYVCGLRGMEAGVLDALHDIAAEHGLAWETLAARLRTEGRLHLETY